MKNVITFVLILLSVLSCSDSNDILEMPQSEVRTLDYSDMDNWAFHPNKSQTLLDDYNLDIAVIDESLQIESVIPITNNSSSNTGVDVFFVHPTVLSQIADSPQNIDIDDQQEFLISATILAQGGLMSKYGRFFAPRYRQSTGTTYLSSTSKELQASVITVSYNDIKASFLDYLSNHNDGNKIILAGHSQGSFMLAMLLRDVFDNDPSLKDRLVTAALGGMGYVYASQNNYSDGWWQTIPLCTMMEECGCIHNWRSFAESQPLPEINTGLPEFNINLVNQGLVYRTVDQEEDWFVQDSLFYGSGVQPLRYIVPDANYNLGGNANFIAFDNLYNTRFKRNGLHEVGLSVEHVPAVNDQRPNDLESEDNHPNFEIWGYHRKDYNIYLWAQMEQVDLKLRSCD